MSGDRQMRDRLHFGFLNFGHFIDHYATLIFATVAALALTREWSMSYAEIAPYATPGFIAFGLFSLPAGWVADRWSRDGMMAVFLVGIGAASVLTSFAQTPLQLGLGLSVVGAFAAIYHPVGLAMVVGKYAKAGMALAINGVWGNLGVACAALATGFLIDAAGWRAAFLIPGAVTIAAGMAYAWLFWPEVSSPNPGRAKGQQASGDAMHKPSQKERRTILIVTIAIFLIITMSGFNFQSTSFALPKVFDERVGGGIWSATSIGWMGFVVFAIGSAGQLVVGSLLDRFSSKSLILAVSATSVVCFSVMPGLTGWPAVLVATGFMLGLFGLLPVTDYIIGKMARSENRSAVYGARYVVTCIVFASAIPVIAWIHAGWGFDALFRILALVSVAMFTVTLALPGKLPLPEVTAPVGKPAAG
jgi:MFS family permease